MLGAVGERATGVTAEAARSGPRILIIGAGHSGLCVAIQALKAGFADVTLLEKADRVGGTWRDNRYPGAACDSPAFAYCFSFEQKTDWSRKWAFQPEILAYQQHCAEKYGLLERIRFGQEVVEANWDEANALWRVRTQTGEVFEAEVLVSGVGQLNRPAIPPIAGLERFRGPCFHSARWDETLDLTGKRVACIGNAASAIQFVPEIAPRVAQLSIFQRSANWMLPKLDREYSETEKRNFARYRPWAWLYRAWLWLSFELRWPVFRRNAWMSRRIEQLAIAMMRRQVKDPALQQALIPDYPIGAKRILISDDYYRTLNRPNVRVVLDPIDHVDESAVVTRGGERIEADVVILATGFQATDFLAPMRITGVGGRSLQKDWEQGARAYLGLTHSGFPNFFMLYGPNTNLGHNSILFMIECQTRYLLDCLRQMRARGLRAIDLRDEVLEAYNARLQQELAGTVWATAERSWYKLASGRITNNWSGPTLRYWWKTRRADLSLYRTTPA